MQQTIYLVGPRAAGKTTFGRALARRLGRAYVDTDVHLNETTGESVADIVAREGWEGFRRRESAALRETTAPDTVVATGGGMVLDPENRRFMRDHGIVLYLRAPASVLAARLSASPNAAQRPSLTGKSIIEEISEVLAVATQEALLAEALSLLTEDGRESLSPCGHSSSTTVQS